MKPLHAFILGTTFGFLLAFGIDEALAHDWYDPACCSGKDCAPITLSNIHATPEGWLITLEPGEHPLLSSPFEELVPYDSYKIRESHDSDFHACIGTMKYLYCLYIPPFGS